MTSPVRTERAPGGGYRISFVMPRKYTLETLPVPKNDRVKFRQVASHDAAAITFTGGVGDSGAKERMTQALLADMAAAGLEAGGEPTLADYYPPFAPGWMRKREVIIPLLKRLA